MTSAVDSLFGTATTTATTAAADTNGTNTGISGSGAAGATGAASTDTLTASVDQLVGILKQIEQKAVSGYTASGATTANVANDALLVNATA